MRFRKSSLLTKILILVMVVYATVTLVSLQNQVTVREAEAERLEAEIETALHFRRRAGKPAVGASHRGTGYRRRRGSRCPSETGTGLQGRSRLL